MEPIFFISHKKYSQKGKGMTNENVNSKLFIPFSPKQKLWIL